MKFTEPVTPKIANTTEPLTLKEGNTVYLVCIVVGVPHPSIQWYKDNKLITQGQHIHSQAVVGLVVFTLLVILFNCEKYI